MIAQYIICPRPPPPPPAAPPAPPPRDVCMFQRRFFDHIARPLVIIEHISCPRPRGSEGCDHLTLYSTLLYYTILFSVVLYGIVVLYCAVSYYILTCRSVEDAPPASTRAKSVKNIILYYIILYYIMLCYITLCQIILYPMLHLPLRGGRTAGVDQGQERKIYYII